MANDSVTSLKLLEKGLLKEDMAVAVLIDFPFQIIGGWFVPSLSLSLSSPSALWFHITQERPFFLSFFVGRVAASWSQGSKPLNPWISAFSVRLLFGLGAMALVYCFPTTTPIPSAYFVLVVLFTVVGSFTRFVSPFLGLFLKKKIK